MNEVCDALYARQSVLKEDSISVESQLEYCKYETRGEPFKEYIDKGYSGKNTNRPAFEELLKDIEAGKISKVIVYKLDRISRSIMDFSNMMEKFQKYRVEFISSTEKFDTSTPIGRAMLNICIVFAQLERETIQKRVADAYYARSKKGFYMGGRIPYGFRMEKTVIDGVNTAKYVPIPEESRQIRLLYEMYGDTNNSLGDIVRYLNRNNIQNLRTGVWSTARISEMLRNPIYVKADAEIYEFFKSQGTRIINPVSDFIGENACYLYQGPVSDTRKQSDLTGKELVLAPHEGIVSSKEWIRCRERCLNNRQSSKTCKPKNSWIAGKVKCGNCGYALTIAKSKTKQGRYFVCSGKLNTKKCNGTGKTVYAALLEQYISAAIKRKLSEFSQLTVPEQNNLRMDSRRNEDKIRLSQIDTEIEQLLDKISNANEILMGYINDKIKQLDAERTRIKEAIKRRPGTLKENDANPIKNPAEIWDEISFTDKQEVTDLLIKVIHIAGDKIEIIWRI